MDAHLLQCKAAMLGTEDGSQTCVAAQLWDFFYHGISWPSHGGLVRWENHRSELIIFQLAMFDDTGGYLGVSENGELTHKLAIFMETW